MLLSIAAAVGLQAHSSAAWLAFIVFCMSCLIQHQLFTFRHNLSENKKFKHHPHKRAMFVSISAFLLCLVSKVSRGEEVAIFCPF